MFIPPFIYNIQTGKVDISGLFHRVVLHSGTPNAYWAVSRKTKPELKEEVVAIGDYLGCKDPDINQQIKCMRNLPYQDLNWDNICMVNTIFL